MSSAPTKSGIVEAPPKAFTHWHSPNGTNVVPQAEVKPRFGLLTWAEEGRESHKNNSRWLHVPGKWSGCTIGRGYDMKEVTGGAKTIEADLAVAMSAGGKKEDIDRIPTLAASCSMKKGEGAFKEAEKFSDFELTPVAQSVLFERAYKRKEQYIEGVYNRALSHSKTNGAAFADLNPAIREVIVDLGYVGQFRPGKSPDLLKAIAANDVAAVRKEVDALDKTGYKKRYQSRLKVLDAEVERQKSIIPPPRPAAPLPLTKISTGPRDNGISRQA